MTFTFRPNRGFRSLSASLLIALSFSAKSSPGFAQSVEPEAAKAVESEDQDHNEAPPVLLSLPLPGLVPAPSKAKSAPEGQALSTADEPQNPLPRQDQQEPPDESEREGEPEALGFSAPGDPWGDTPGLGVISLRALMQFRYASTFAAKSTHSLSTGREAEEYLAEKNDGYSMKRLLVRLSSDPVKHVGFKSVIDLSELMSNDPENVVKQAYVVLRPMPERIELVAGLFKSPFAILELDPSSRYELADLGPTNSLLNDLGYAGRDLGLMLSVAPLKKARKLRVSGGAFRGHAYGEHDSPAGSLVGRIEYKPKRWLRFGGGLSQMMNDYSYNRVLNTSGSNVLPNPPDLRYPRQKNWGKGRAFGVDARIKKKGFMLRGEFIMGDRIDLDERYGAHTFWSAWGLAAYRINVGSIKLLPTIRAEWLDANREAKSGLWRTLSAGLTAILLERIRVLVDVTRTDVSASTPLLNQPKPLTNPPYMALDQTRVTVQMQLEL